MYTPSEIQEKQFKTGLGYDKKDVEQFLNDISSEFNNLQLENEELKKKMDEANESLSYYKTIEKTLQKALILAEKTAQDTRTIALKEADAIELEAKAKAQQILNDSKKQLEMYEHKTLNLIQQYELFKIHFENLLHAQSELLNSKSFSLNTEHYSYSETHELKDNERDALAQEEPLNSIDRNSEDVEGVVHIPEDKNQLIFDFPNSDKETASYQTEDGFEFFTMKDE